MAQSDDMIAINTYMRNTSAKTKFAAQIRAGFIGWYDDLGWYDLNLNSDTYNNARAKRDSFNRANAVTPEEKAVVEQILASGMTTEQMQGKDRPEPSISVPKKIMAHPTIRKGSKGDGVKEWQRILGLKDDGNFGIGTESKTIVFQKAHSIPGDGIVGPKTWMAAYVSDTVYNGTALPDAVVDSTKNLPPARAPSVGTVAKKAAQGTVPRVVDKPIGIPVSPKMLEAGIFNVSTWGWPMKITAGAAAILALIFGKRAIER